MTKKSYVYLILDSERNAIKIGKANNIEERLSDLQTGNPNKLEVLSYIPCKTEKQSEDLEKILHKKYSDLNILNEWFQYDKEAFKELIESGIEFTAKPKRNTIMVNTVFGEEDVFGKHPWCHFYPFLKAQTLNKYEKVANKTIKWRTMEYPTNGEQKMWPISPILDRVFISDRKHKQNLEEKRFKEEKEWKEQKSGINLLELL